jgi:sialate O-acetylesterase
VPIGLINRAAGGTSMRSWLPLSAENDPDPTVQAILATWDGWGDEYQHQVQPLAGFAIRGIVYWQGEQDLKLARQDPGNIDHFYHLLPALARAWRADWQIGQIPFVFVQLPTGGGLQQGQVVTPLPPSPPSPDIAMRMRQATFNGLSEPGTALMVSIDIPGSVHPRDHDLYGYRLATAALGTTYGESFAYSGPIYASMSIESGGHVRLKFKPNTADALQAVGGPLQGFSISADGQNFVWAQAEIQANEVVVWNDSIPSPSVVHYAWDKYPTWANLFNGAGLGTAPFSTTETPAP